MVNKTLAYIRAYNRENTKIFRPAILVILVGGGSSNLYRDLDVMNDGGMCKRIISFLPGYFSSVFSCGDIFRFTFVFITNQFLTIRY